MPGNIHEVPEHVLAHWPEPNYVDPVTRSWLPAFAFVFPAVSTVLIAGRFWLRATKQAGGFGLDDVFIFLGWITSIGLSIVAYFDAVWYDLDRHTWDVNPIHYQGAAKCGWVAQVFFLISTCATKTSTLLFYRRMVADTYSRRWLYAIWAALGFLGGYFLSIFLAYCFICRPLSAYWLSYNFDYDQEFTCINGNILSPFVGALSVFTDIYAVILPCAMLAKVNLNVPKRQKFGLNLIFALGTVVAGFGIARTYYLWEINNLEDYDTSWTGFELFVWSLLECHFAVIFACAPSLRAFIRRYLEQSFQRTFRSQSRSQSKSGSKGQTVEIGPNGSATRQSGVPMQDYNKFPEQRVSDKSSQAALAHERNYYDGDSSAPSSRHGNPSFRNADEYEAYAIQQLNRHRSMRSEQYEGATVYDYGDPKRRHDVDNAV